MARDATELLEMGQRIKDLRAAYGYKQQWIADQLGVELRTYQFWQQGKHAPEQEHLEKLAKLFEVTPRYILKGETPPAIVTQDDVLSAVSELVEQVRKLRGELVTRDAEAKKQISEVARSIQRLLPPPQHG